MNLTIAIAQLTPTKGRYLTNLAQLGDLFAQLADLTPRPDLLLLPETALTGYFLEGGVREAARSAAELAADLAATYRGALGDDAPPLDVCIGFYERHRDKRYNSAAYLELGGGETRLRHIHRKVFLPTYGVFDEARFVEAGRQVAAFDTRWGRAAILICEDAWHSLNGTIAALDGAQLVLVPSASPARGARGPQPENVAHWEDLMRRIADEHGVFAALAQLTGFEGGKGFPGGSLLMGPDGTVRVAGPLWQPALLAATIDLDDLALARAGQPLLADLETMLPHLQRELARSQESEARSQESEVRSQKQILSPSHPVTQPPSHPVTPSPRHPASRSPILPVFAAPPPDPLADVTAFDAELVRQWLVAFLRDEVTRRRGFRDVVVGLSGGVDSALTTYLCAEAFGPEHVLAVRMPYRSSSRESLEHAQLVVDALGVRCATVDISAAVDGYASLDPEIDARRKGNIMARTRMIVLFDHAQKLGTIPIGTGNKTERLFGYYTWHADDSPPVNPLGDLFKSQVWALSRYLGIAPAIVDKPASADLVAGQTDEGDFGISYARADKILHYVLRGYSDDRLIALGFDASDVALVRRRVDGTHWKRRLPSTAMISATAIGEFYLRPVDY